MRWTGNGRTYLGGPRSIHRGGVRPAHWPESLSAGSLRRVHPTTRPSPSLFTRRASVFPSKTARACAVHEQRRPHWLAKAAASPHATVIGNFQPGAGQHPLHPSDGQPTLAGQIINLADKEAKMEEKEIGAEWGAARHAGLVLQTAERLTPAPERFPPLWPELTGSTSTPTLAPLVSNPPSRRPATLCLCLLSRCFCFLRPAPPPRPPPQPDSNILARPGLASPPFCRVVVFPSKLDEYRSRSPLRVPALTLLVLHHPLLKTAAGCSFLPWR